MLQASSLLPRRVVILALSVGIAGVAWLASGAGGMSTALAQRAGIPGSRGPQSVAPVVEGLIDAVVNISTTQVTRGPQGVPLPNVPKGSPFDEFFEEFFNKRGGGTNPKRKVSSLGSGFVIDGKEGLVVTNNHVIAGADEIVINFNDGTKLKVDKVLGRDEKTDLALLKVTPVKPLVDVQFGKSRVLKVGDWVMAIGNPFGLGGSVTVGIISAKQRDINSGPYDEYLQTDAAINKGNSGGPLFNMDGEVIGINTAIISPTGGSIGIGFAVPSDTATLVVGQLLKYGETRRGWLGVHIQTVSEEIAESLGVAANTGALVSSVEVPSPAEKAGIIAGDVIVRFNGQSVTRMRGLPGIVARAEIGESVEVEVLRDGSKRTLKVVVGRLRDEKSAKSDQKKQNNGGEPGAQEVYLGLSLSVLTGSLRDRYRIDSRVAGVVVTAVDPKSAAAERNIKVGDVIVEAGQSVVKVPGDIGVSIEKMRAAKRSAVLLRIEDSKGDLRFVAVPIK